MLDEREKELEFSEVKSVNNMKVVNAKLEAFNVLARGDEQMVRTEVRKKQREKVRVREKLSKVVESIEDARMDGLKDLVKELKKEERDVQASLRAVEVALDALEDFGAEADAKELLALAKRERAELKSELKCIRQKKGQVDVQRTRVNVVPSDREKRTGMTNMNKIVPVVLESRKSAVGDRGNAMEMGSIESETSGSDDEVEAPVRPQKPAVARFEWFGALKESIG